VCAGGFARFPFLRSKGEVQALVFGTPHGDGQEATPPNGGTFWRLLADTARRLNAALAGHSRIGCCCSLVLMVTVPRSITAGYFVRETWQRAAWRWHFYAGMMIGPILFVVAATGGSYVFREEIERHFSADVSYVEPGSRRVSYETMLTAATKQLGGERRPARIEISADPERSVGVLFYGDGDDSFHRIHVDPYRGEVLGESSTIEYFNFALQIHRGIFAGLPGRMIAELSASWTVILSVTGVFLWWPCRWQRGAGVIWPRWWLAPYVFWRDCHAMCGAAVMPIAVTIAGTGLLYTFVWGQAFNRAAQYTNSYTLFVDNPKSSPTSASRRIALDEIVGRVRAEYPAANFGIDLPRATEESYVVGITERHGPNTTAILVFDAYSGNELARRRHADAPPLQRWNNWAYRLHTGSALGMVSKIAWSCTCLVLMALPVTGAWMWWQRRPRGSLGLPRSRDGKLPRGAILLIAAFGLVLPMFGLSVLAIALVRGFARLIRGR